MREILKFDIKSVKNWILFKIFSRYHMNLIYISTQNGTLSAIPYLGFWLFIILSGIIGDKLISKFKFKKNTVRKIFNSLGMLLLWFS